MDPRAVENTGIEGKVFSLEDTLLAGLLRLEKTSSIILL